MDSSCLYALIMAGGQGTRFWPLSRESRPKQLLAIAGPDPMLRTTVDRVLPLVPPERVLIVTGAAHAREVKAIAGDLPPENIVVEPVGRNTAPCIGLAAHVALARDPEAVTLVLPADHVIEKAGEFLEIARAGASLAASEKALVTLGIVPTHPETGYGYIEAGAEEFDIEGFKTLSVLSFHEKPGAEEARAYLDRGSFYWNSGMFIWEARTILEWIKRLLPDLSRGLESLAACLGRADFEAALERVYPGLESVSIDYGVMEKAEGVMVLPADIGWSDVGSWTAAARYWPRVQNNEAHGQTLFIDSSGCAVYSPEKLVALIGVKDLVVVETPEALLICPKDRDQDVRRVVEILKKKGRLDLV